MDDAIARVVDSLDQCRRRQRRSATAARSASAQEPLDLFRRYVAAYARDQAYCYFSPALISNLERNWDAHNRKN